MYRGGQLAAGSQHCFAQTALDHLYAQCRKEAVRSNEVTIGQQRVITQNRSAADGSFGAVVQKSRHRKIRGVTNIQRNAAMSTCSEQDDGRGASARFR